MSKRLLGMFFAAILMAMGMSAYALEKVNGAYQIGTAEDFSALYEEMNAQITPEAKLYKALDKLEAVIQHNEAPLSTWSANEYELNKTYGTDATAYSEWLTVLRNEIRNDTIEKIG